VSNLHEGQQRLTRFKLAVQHCYSDLSPQERKVADFLVSEEKGITDIDLGEISKRSGTSNASVVRFCKRLGYNGLKELKIDLCDTESFDNSMVSWDDDYDTIFSKVFSQSIKTMETSFHTTSSKMLLQASELIASASTIDIIAVGGSSLVAGYCKTELLRLGKHINSLTDVYSIEKLSASLITPPADLLIAVSCSGETACVVKAASAALKRGSRLVAVTTSPGSTLAKLTDTVVYSNICPVFCDDVHSYTRIVQITQITTMYLMAVSIMGKNDASFKANYIDETNYRNIV
jgi:DNA-binding MurR/RpiR family transcriptional regulator